VPAYRIGQAAALLGVSTDTMRRWVDAGRVKTVPSEGSRRAVDGADLARLAVEVAGTREPVVIGGQSARNRFPGIITKVVTDTVAAQVDIQAGPHRFVALITREAVDQLGLVPGMLAEAVVKATNVGIELAVDG
jgi:molybdopterin-binding protein